VERKNKGKPFVENTLFGTKRKIFGKTGGSGLRFFS
jgi:hypothetical protein